MTSVNSYLDSVDLTRPGTFVEHDPHEFWFEVRRQRPVYWHDTPGRNTGFWVVAKYTDILSAYNNPSVLTSTRGNVLDVLLRGGDPAGGRMLAVTDGARHRKLRTVLLRAFSPRVLRNITQKVHHRAAQLVDSVTDVGTFDFATEVAEQIPMNTICDLLSVPGEDRRQLLEWSKVALSSDNPGDTFIDSLEARNEIILYFTELAQDRRARPKDDVVSMMSTTTIDGHELTFEEIALNCYSLILGGDESSRTTAIGAVHALAKHPDQWRTLTAGTTSLDTAVEEVLRWTTPAMHFARTATQDLVIGSQRVRAGDVVTLWNTSANTDESIFAAPRTFDLARSPNKHVTFGHGPHFCLGAFLGRAELHALLAALVNSVGDLDLDGQPAQIYSNFIYGYGSLPVGFQRSRR